MGMDGSIDALVEDVLAFLQKDLSSIPRCKSSLAFIAFISFLSFNYLRHAGKPMYLGWLLAAGIPKLVCNLLSSSQLVLILDLNHTLVESHSIESLERRKEECGRERQELCKKIHEGSQCDRWAT
eukprot:scaffold70555_cov15-Tisochrysis_lutea.AAC.1